MLPNGGDTLAEVIEDVAAFDTVTGGQEAADDAGDVTADIEPLRLVDALALHTEAEAAYAGEHYGIALGERCLQGILQIGYHSDGGRLVVASRHHLMIEHVTQGNVALAYCLCKVFPV